MSPKCSECILGSTQLKIDIVKLDLLDLTLATVML